MNNTIESATSQRRKLNDIALTQAKYDKSIQVSLFGERTLFSPEKISVVSQLFYPF